MKKIAIVYPFFPHYRGPIINKLLEDDQYEFHFIAGEKVNKNFSSLKLYDFGESGSERFTLLSNYWFCNVFLFQKGLTKILRNFDGVIFFGDWKYLSTWLILPYLKRKRIPTFFWSHGILTANKDLNNWLKFKFFNSFSHGGFLYSSRAKFFLNERGYEKPLSVIYNSLDYEKQLDILNEVQNTEYNSELKPYVIFIGRLIKARKLEILFEVLARFRENGQKLSLLIIGDGPYKKELEDFSIQLALQNNIKFVGSCYDERYIGKCFVNSIGCVYPGPIGLTIIHSFTYGIPVITNDDIDNQKPEIEALMDGKNGFFFTANDPNSLYDKIAALLQMENEERKEFDVESKRVVADKFNPTSQSIKIKELLAVHI